MLTGLAISSGLLEGQLPSDKYLSTWAEDFVGIHQWATTGEDKNKTNSVGFSPRANYTDWATATCRRNLVPTFVDREVSRGQRGGSTTVVNLSFLDRSYFSFKWPLIYSHNGWVDPVPDLLLFKSGSAGNRTRDLWVCSQEIWPIDHRGCSAVVKCRILWINGSVVWSAASDNTTFYM
jgi:hypothetical protein